MAVQPNEGMYEDDRRSLEVFSTLDSALHDEECETVKGLSDDGHSYAGTVVRGVLRGDSEFVSLVSLRRLGSLLFS